MEVIYRQDSELLFNEGAARLFSAVKQGAGTFNLALPGGRSVVGLLRAMRRGAAALTPEQWGRINIFMTDERCVPIDHPESNFKLLKDECLTSLVESKLLRDSQLHPFVVGDDRNLAARNYSLLLERYGGKYNAVVLGVGEDAHVGAVFPDHHSFDDESDYFLTMTDSPKPPPVRMTSSRKLIERSDLAIALFIGAAKREAYQKFCDGKVPLRSCPAKIALSAGATVVLTDIER